MNRGPSSNSELLPEPGVCGSFLTNKIYGGVETKIDEYPWMALIEYQKREFFYLVLFSFPGIFCLSVRPTINLLR